MKKSCNRFTIKFNPEIAKHVNAAEILNDLGRKKANYVAEAIDFYSKHKDVSLGELNLDLLENLIKQIIQNQQNKSNELDNSDSKVDILIIEEENINTVEKTPVINKEVIKTTEKPLEKVSETSIKELVEHDYSKLEIGKEEMEMLSDILGNFRN